MKKSSFSQSVCKVYVSTLKVISVISDRAHKKVCWLGVKVHIHISTLFLLCPFVFILSLEVWGDNFLQQEASVSRMLWTFFFAGGGVSCRSWLMDRKVDQDMSHGQSQTKSMLGRDFKLEDLWSKHAFGFNVWLEIWRSRLSEDYETAWNSFKVVG